MSMNLLNIARTGVLASQSQLAVTSNNIANANTQGYHRQVAEQSSLESQRAGSEFYGSGTYISDVKRIYNDYAARELRIGQTGASEAQTTHTKMSELDQLFSQIGKAVPQGLNDFFAGLNSLSDLPDDIGIRGSVLGSAGQLASSLNQMQSHLDGQMKQTNDQIVGITDRINEISKELGHINQELMKSQGEDAQLLDKQDALIQELSQYSEVNVIPLDTGAKSIMLGGAVMLVSGEVSMSIGTTPGDPHANQSRISASVGSYSQVIDGSKLGGQIGALFEFRDDTLIKAQQELGQLSLGVADAFNQAQKEGFDLNGEVGQDIFKDINDPTMSVGRVGAFSSNNGAGLRVNIDDAGQLSGNSYELTYTAGAPDPYELKDTLTGNITPLTLNGTQLDGANGFTIHINTPGLADGDKFEIRPAAGAAAGIGVVMTDPKGIAAAAPKISPDAANSGNTEIEMVSIDNRGNLNFPLTGSELTFVIDTGANTYEVFDVNGAIVGGANVPFTTINPPTISAYGFTFGVTSTAAVTDTFTFDLAFAPGDNTNSVAMSKLSETKLMNGGTSTLADVYQGTKLSIGGKTKAAEVAMGSAQAVYSQAYSRVQSESGVNIDEEAANLLRFQQAYQASARIMTTASEIFDTLFSSTR
ncbi:flagellar hook-associated protein FlgK [Shewanella canadensis]|uniref:Flagellar hook-associated protein 1 n=1 Tax=Shewanella canadensis TaxID=271096 RepID=A0A3S0KWN0_9GAMM|nr:flagellar hook-associated protein FlgK [Shewanella canadensis]RTR39328.1 flagellar hook-associated protein FlgK [Shewanella canadensis]